MKLFGEANQSLFTAHDSKGNSLDIKETVFPILIHSDDGILKMLGTGFFITRLGIFLSAKHVFEEVLDKKGNPESSLTILQFRENHTYYLRPVKAFITHPEADVAIGICHNMSHKKTGEPMFNKVVTLSKKFPKINENVYTYAYPGTIVKQTSITNISFNAKFYAGNLLEYYPNGRDKVLLPFPCYRTSIVLHGGSSGGPVFGKNGNVFGINSTGFENDTVSFVSRVQDAFNLLLKDVVMPGTTEPSDITLNDLVNINHISIK